MPTPRELFGQQCLFPRKSCLRWDSILFVSKSEQRSLQAWVKVQRDSWKQNHTASPQISALFTARQLAMHSETYFPEISFRQLPRHYVITIQRRRRYAKPLRGKKPLSLTFRTRQMITLSVTWQNNSKISRNGWRK